LLGQYRKLFKVENIVYVHHATFQGTLLVVVVVVVFLLGFADMGQVRSAYVTQIIFYTFTENLRSKFCR
jgi:hypothetical protein